MKSNPLILMGMYFGQTFYLLSLHPQGRDLVTILQGKIWREEEGAILEMPIKLNSGKKRNTFEQEIAWK